MTVFPKVLADEADWERVCTIGAVYSFRAAKMLALQSPIDARLRLLLVVYGFWLNASADS